MDKHSKRNKSKDNPYTLSYNETTSSYVVEFKDNKNIIHKVEISDEVYQDKELYGYIKTPHQTICELLFENISNRIM